MASWHLVAPGGEVHSGGRAFAPLMRLLPAARPLALAFARFPSAADRVYVAVADRRAVLGRLVSSGARARARSRVERRERTTMAAHSG